MNLADGEIGQEEAVGEIRSSSPRERVIDAPELAMTAEASPVLLSIDTSLGTTAALGVAGRIYEATSDDSRGHAESIGTIIDRVFDMGSVAPAEVSGVVIGVGPGPFTGLRVGIAAAHAFALGRGVPVLPLLGHEAVALAALAPGAATGARVVQDAKRRELFVTEFSSLDWRGVPVREADPRLISREDYRAEAIDLWPERVPAARLVQLAARRLASAGVREGDRGFEADRAVYLRTPDVKAPSLPKRVIP